jgi:hypothetical protein
MSKEKQSVRLLEQSERERERRERFRKLALSEEEG